MSLLLDENKALGISPTGLAMYVYREDRRAGCVRPAEHYARMQEVVRLLSRAFVLATVEASKEIDDDQ